ncbi:MULTISPECIES: hypothetical protein [unclassified Chelatococcus]|uniref:hypothetical protein n=1 Tax=unclassified Chelatococcus TaxID=2638111 RepID=UPI001BD09602|nr:MULTISPECIES: hypothetical protein [unclassified Chelatococcus]MBS7699155.1 hypothetical protein [Chelatococcus sp. YT9]MBX3554936.1 hypothetical protein [Chelatococcus sp.]
MPQNIILCYRPYAATLTQGSWHTALPLTNALTADTAEVARSTNTALASTRFKADFGVQRSVRAFFIRGANASLTAKLRLRGFADSAMTIELHDSAWFSLFPSVWSLSIPWESPDFWMGAQEEWLDEERRAPIVYLLPSSLMTAAWLVEFDDTGNPDGFIQFDRFYVGECWQPSLNYTYSGNGFSFLDQTDVETSVNGVESFRRKIAPKSFRFGFDYLSEAEGWTTGYDLNRWAGSDREVLVIPDPDDATTIKTRSFIGRLSRMDALAQVACGYMAAGYEIKEML